MLVIDDMGYIPFGHMESQVFFYLVSKRYGRRTSLILTSNKSYCEWGTVFGDSITVPAILDRLLHRLATVNIRREGLSSPGKSKSRPPGLPAGGGAG